MNIYSIHIRVIFCLRKKTVNFDAVTVAQSGFTKAVSKDGVHYEEDAKVKAGNSYSYRLRYTQKKDTKSDSVVFYDILEQGNASEHSSWQGAFKSVDVSAIDGKPSAADAKASLKPVVYYATVIPTSDQMDLSNEIWSTQKPANAANVKAIAVDARKTNKNSNFVLGGEQTLSVFVYLTAPTDAIFNGKKAVNQASAQARTFAGSVAGENDQTHESKASAAVVVEVPSTEVSGTKTWEDANNQDGKRPDEIIVRLLANGKDTGKSAIVNADSAWKYVFANLNIFAKDGSKYTYSVIEDAVEGYTSSVDGFDITNTHNPEKVSVSVHKNWVGPVKDKAEINLLADGTTVASVVLNNENNWQHTFSNLDKYKQGKEIAYKVKEVPVEGYTSSVSGSAKDGFSVTNTIIIPKISIDVTKTWVDGDGNSPDHPEVEVALLADGEHTGKTIKLNEANAWKASFNDLDKIKQDGTAIKYSVEEVSVPEHFTAEVNGTAKDGFVVTNTYKPVKEEPETPAKPEVNKKDTTSQTPATKPKTSTSKVPATGDKPYALVILGALAILSIGVAKKAKLKK